MVPGTVRTNAGLSTIRVTKVESLHVARPVYNITVEGSHDYFANGLLVHNCDELAAWMYAKDTWSMMQFGLRLGKHTQLLWTTTPKPVPIIKERVKEEDKTHIIVRGTTYENKANLAQSFYNEVAKFEGTKLGRQELHGELIDPEESGIVQRSQWKLWPSKKPLPRFEFILMSLDTAFTERTFDKDQKEPDPTACSVWGAFRIGKAFNVMLLDAWSDFLGFPELVKKVRSEAKITYGQADEPLLGHSLIPSMDLSEQGVMMGKPIDLILIEDKGSGKSLRQTLAIENLLMEPYNPGKADKLARMHAITPMFSHGRVWAVESKIHADQPVTWADACISEICSYHGPGTTDHDDYVDTMTQAMNFFMRRFVRTFEVEPRTREERESEAEYNTQRVNPYAC